MNFICPDCGSQYLVDESKVGAEGVALSCGQCGGSFRVRRRPTTRGGAVSPAQPPPPPPLPPLPAAPAGRGAAAKPSAPHPSGSGPLPGWRLRTRSGVVPLDGLETLQRWVSEGRITRDAEISRTGDAWRRLGDIEELAPIFRVAEAAGVRRASGAHPSASERPGPLLAEPSGPRALGLAPALRDEPAFASHSAARTLPSAFDDHAAWEHHGASGAAFDQRLSHHRPPARREHRARIIGVVAAAVLLLAVGATVALQSARLHQAWQRFWGGADDLAERRAQVRARLAQDDEASLTALERELAADARPDARVWRAELLAIWAQHLRDQAELLERQARQRTAVSGDAASAHRPSGATPALAPGAAPAPPPPPDDELSRRDARALRLQAAKLRDTAAGQLATAEAQLRAVTTARPAPIDLARAQADVGRMLGQAEVPALLQRAQAALPEDPELAYVEGLYWQEHNDIARAVGLLETAVARGRAGGGPVLLRASLALSMIHLRSGWYADAKRHADLVRALNPAHGWAAALLQQIVAEIGQAQPGRVAAAPAVAADAQVVARDGGVAAAVATGAASEAAPSAVAPAGALPGAAGAGDAPTGSAAGAVGGSYESLVRAADQASEHGRTMQALSAYERALRVRPDGVEAITGLGYCALDLQQLGQAIQRFTQALSLRPSHGDAMVGLGEAYRAMGDKARAVDAYRAYLRLHPNGPKARMAEQNAKELGDAPAPAPGPDPGPEGSAAPASEAPAGDTAPGPEGSTSDAPGADPAPAPSRLP